MVGGQLQDSKKVIAEVLPEVTVLDVDVSDSVIDQLEHVSLMAK